MLDAKKISIRFFYFDAKGVERSKDFRKGSFHAPKTGLVQSQFSLGQQDYRIEVHVGFQGFVVCKLDSREAHIMCLPQGMNVPVFIQEGLPGDELIVRLGKLDGQAYQLVPKEQVVVPSRELAAA